MVIPRDRAVAAPSSTSCPASAVFAVFHRSRAEVKMSTGPTSCNLSCKTKDRLKENLVCFECV